MFGYFLLLAIMNNAAMNIYVIFVWWYVLNSFGYPSIKNKLIKLKILLDIFT